MDWIEKCIFTSSLNTDVTVLSRDSFWALEPVVPPRSALVGTALGQGADFVINVLLDPKVSRKWYCLGLDCKMHIHIFVKHRNVTILSRGSFWALEPVGPTS